MRRRLKIGLIGIGVILMVAAAAVAWFLSAALPIGAGFTAKYLCSSTFISQRNPETVFQQDVAPLNPVFKAIDWHVSPEQKTVSADYFGLFTTMAIYREGCGCSLVIGTSAEAMRRQTFYRQSSDKVQPARRDDLSWPAGSQGPVDPASLGIDPRALRKALDAAFAESGPAKTKKTRAIIIPSKKLVLVRFGATSDRKSLNTDEFIANVLVAIPN